ncbi:MAG TPA: DNRLRE domain-containing protein, partial [Herpetosiphonaceae bacterium]
MMAFYSHNHRHIAGRSQQQRLIIGLFLLAIAVAVISPLLYASLSASAQTAGTLVLAPVADTYVSAEEPAKNFGAERRIAIDGNPDEQSFIRFAVQGISGPVASAVLRLQVANPSPAANGTIRLMSNTTWSETETIYTNRPAIDGAQVGTFNQVADGMWVEINVTSAITGAGVYSFGITQTGIDGVNFISREVGDASKRPQLVISASGGISPPATPVPTVEPKPSPSVAPSPSPSVAPTAVPSPSPSVAPSPSPSASPAPPAAFGAFPGAEGYGSQTVGGRGGRIIYVTNLADSGPGSLRSALEATGPRTVLFQVAGTINLNNDISITQPFVTVAGQSAVGQGVQLKGGMIKIRTHDVVLRYLKIRA